LSKRLPWRLPRSNAFAEAQEDRDAPSLELDPAPTSGRGRAKKGDAAELLAAETENLARSPPQDGFQELRHGGGKPGGRGGIAFEADDNEVTLVMSTGETVKPREPPSKLEIANPSRSRAEAARFACRSMTLSFCGVTSRSIGTQITTVYRRTRGTRSAPRLSGTPTTSEMPALPGICPTRAGGRHPRESGGHCECTRCRLHEGRRRIISASETLRKARLRGRGPGADEDAQAFRLLTRRSLLTQMIENTAKRRHPLTRGDIYICNVVKCRPQRTDAASGRNGNLRTVPVPATGRDPSEGTALVRCGQGAAWHEGRCDTTAGNGTLARHPRDGHTPFFPAARLQPECCRAWGT
jgi:hypothetical protein